MEIILALLLAHDMNGLFYGTVCVINITLVLYSDSSLFNKIAKITQI